MNRWRETLETKQNKLQQQKEHFEHTSEKVFIDSLTYFPSLFYTDYGKAIYEGASPILYQPKALGEECLILTSTIILTVGRVVARFCGWGGRTVMGIQPAYKQP